MKLWIRRILNLLLWLNVCLLTGTGIVLFFRLPHGPQGRGFELWGLGRHDWGALHAWGGAVFVMLVLAHLVLAWPWLKNAAAKRRLWPVLGGLVAGLVVVLVLAFSRVEQASASEGQGQEGGHGWRAERH